MHRLGNGILRNGILGDSHTAGQLHAADGKHAMVQVTLEADTPVQCRPPERNAAIQHQNCLYQHLQPNQPEHTDRIDGKILYFPASGLLHPRKQMDDDGKFACDKHGDQRCPARTDTGIVRSGEAKKCFQENVALCLIHILPRHAGTGIDSS